MATPKTPNFKFVPSDCILLKDALELMRKRDINGHPVPFTIDYVTLDVARKSGGKRIVTKAIMPHTRINGKMYRNAIRHIRIAGIDRPVPVHIYLMLYINGKYIL